MTGRNIFLLTVSIIFFAIIIATIIARKLHWFLITSLIFVVISAIYAGLCVFLNTDLLYRRYYAIEFWVIFISLIILGYIYINNNQRK